ncbi:hypothetical protein DEU56DRAFT_487681 [Suillus clintonianus]|uniref:uncharacterized protein n=1 Tax=Suillus clintonianus TaxID=1904413 RepID=UPI001B86E994|nr:uncharacterized protein DEU56DRAFT_487681 [Suillus clintonianus]KAG2129905.1 hypothetical protein DEU56DRAFT_487681 [Suillus clintonianus]
MPATNEPLFTPPQAEAEGLATYNTSAERLPLSDYDLRYPSSSPENRHPAIEDMAPSQYVDEGTKEIIAQASHFPANGSPEAGDQPLQLLATDSDIMLLHPPGSPIMSKLDILPETTISAGPAAPAEPEDSSTRASLSAVDVHPPGSPIMSKLDILPETTISAGPAAPAEPEDSSASLSTVDIQLVVSSQADIDDVVLGFHMLDLHEVLSPWVPISPTAPSVYVPPAVQHLITAMNRQLEIECQARRRAEELYLEEMRKRIKMEEVVDKLQKERE